MTVKIQARRDTAANWTSANPVLSSGEPGFEVDTNKLKIGDGSTAWNSLNYIGGGDAAGADTQIQFNTAGQFDASANLTYDGALNVKGTGTTSATQTLRLTNSAATNLMTVYGDGQIVGKNMVVSRRVAIGVNAAPNDTSIDGVAIGDRAAQLATGGAVTFVAIGSRAGNKNNAGERWLAIGQTAAFESTSGSFFVAMGANAGYSNTTGNDWLALGKGAGGGNLTGSDWTALGSEAGAYVNGTGTTAHQYFTDCTYIGAKVRGTPGTVGTPTTNEMVIGYAAQGKGSNTINFGNTSVTANYFSGRIETTSSGTTSATQALKLSNSAATNLLTMNDDGTFNGKNIAIGEYTGATRIGENAAPSATGIYWTAIGLNAGFSNTIGSNWTAIGLNAGFSNTTGSSWTAIGRSAGQSSTTGSNWMAIGASAGFNNTTGNNWTAIGRNAGRYIKGTTAALQYYQNSTYIGTNTKGTNGTSTVLTDNETVIGYAAEGNGSNTVTIGSSAVTDNYFTGDIHAQGSGKGIIVTSPDGLTTRRIGIDNSGNLVITTP